MSGNVELEITEVVLFSLISVTSCSFSDVNVESYDILFAGTLGLFVICCSLGVVSDPRAVRGNMKG